jgi:hypothetical protein
MFRIHVFFFGGPFLQYSSTVMAVLSPAARSAAGL